MSDAVEDFISASRAGTLGEAPEPTESVTETPPDQPEAPAATAETPAPADVPPRPKFKLDDVDLDDPDLPESLRGQSARAIAEERKRAITEVQRLANERNRLEAERDAAQDLLAKLAKRLEAEKAPPPPKATPTDRIRSRGVEPAQLYSDAERTLSTVVEAGAEEAEERLNPRLAQMQQELEDLKRSREEDALEKRREITRTAFQVARPENVPPEVWNGDFLEFAAGYAPAKKLATDDPTSYREAWNAFNRIADKVRPVTAPSPTPAAPVAAAPPVGAARPAAVQKPKASAQLNNHARHAAAATVAIFKENAPSLDVDELVNETMNDPRFKERFP